MLAMHEIPTSLSKKSISHSQEAVGASLEKETALIGKQGSFFKEMQEYFQSKRDEMASVLKEIGLNPIVPESGYFMLVDTTPLGGWSYELT